MLFSFHFILYYKPGSIHLIKRTAKMKFLRFELLYPFSNNDLVAVSTVPEGFVNDAIQVVIKIPVPG
jgi:hypothetical protein